MQNSKVKSRITRKRRIRAKIVGTAQRPRVSIFRSNKFIYAQVINDDKGATLASAKGKDGEKVGEELAQKAIKAKVKSVVFDRGGYKYHGNVKKVADAMRAKGVEL